jgi:hypothetical protein
VGGNGYIEDHPTARLNRDAMVLSVWEGPEQIQALELMRVALVEKGADALQKRMKAAMQTLPDEMRFEKKEIWHLKNHIEGAFTKLATGEAAPEVIAARLMKYAAKALAYTLLCEEAAWDLANRNDQTKLLAAKHYYQHARIHDRIDFKVSPLQQQFSAVMQGLPIAPAPKPVPPIPTPAPAAVAPVQVAAPTPATETATPAVVPPAPQTPKA